MRVVAASTLRDYVRNRVSRSERSLVEAHLQAWLALTEHARWRNSSELKSAVRSASGVSAERVVFNIRGNRHRLIAAVNYHYGIVMVKWLGTHEEYDLIDVKTVMYDKERYANPPDSK